MNHGQGRSFSGFTLVEVLMVLAILTLIMAGSFQAVQQFRRAFDSGEQHTRVLGEATRFVENLRRDLENAVPPWESAGATFRGSISCTPGRLSFPIFSDEEGTVTTVIYEVLGNALQRTVGSARPRTLVTDSLASISWSLNEDGSHRVSSFQAGRAWIHLEVLFGRPDGRGNMVKVLPISTNLFPVRWNRAVQRNPQ